MGDGKISLSSSFSRMNRDKFSRFLYTNLHIGASFSSFFGGVSVFVSKTFAFFRWNFLFFFNWALGQNFLCVVCAGRALCKRLWRSHQTSSPAYTLNVRPLHPSLPVRLPSSNVVGGKKRLKDASGHENSPGFFSMFASCQYYFLEAFICGV